MYPQDAPPTSLGQRSKTQTYTSGLHAVNFSVDTTVDLMRSCPDR